MRGESEKETRLRRIEAALIAAGWPAPSGVRPLQGPFRVHEFPTPAGPADFALGVDGRVVALVEAKKVGADPYSALEQGERYASALDARATDRDQLPFIYSTNGEKIWFRDRRHPGGGIARPLAGFHTPAALSKLAATDPSEGFEWTAANPPAHRDVRDYQLAAVDAVERTLAAGKRRALVTMATGTGKTRTTVYGAYRALQAGIANRVLFLVDRNALAVQAAQAFASFEVEPGLKFNQVYEVYHGPPGVGSKASDVLALPQGYLVSPKDGQKFVYICTVQRMARLLFGETGEQDQDDDDDLRAIESLSIPTHAFDYVIADEIHRGYTAQQQSLWRDTLNYYDARVIGLTATPALHTVSFFGDIAYRYTYEQAVEEGYLVDYDAVAIDSRARMHGLFLEAGTPIGIVDRGTGVEDIDVLEAERTFDSSSLERDVTAPDSTRRIIEEVKKYADAHQAAHGRFPKTLIFATHDIPHVSHADALVRAARDIFGRGDDFVQKITGSVDRPLQRIREFRNRPAPGIAVTVDLLSTGVDFPDLEFIVLARPIKSRILFEQILGRGTRRGEQLLDKSNFVVFDSFGGTILTYFQGVTGITAEPPQDPARSLSQLIDDIWNNVDRAHNVNCLVKRLLRIDKAVTAEGRDLISRFVGTPDIAEFARSLPRRLEDDFVGTMGILRDPRALDALTAFPRPPKPFLIAYDAADEVSSQWLIRGADGNEYRPEEYIGAFEEFVRDHRDEIDAIRVLLEEPGAWSPREFKELRDALAAARVGFRVPDLQRAYAAAGVDRADPISMVKHAVNRSTPLLAAEDRVSRAIDRLRRPDASPEQLQWWDRIRAHAEANLSIDRSDFEVVPILTRAGGWRRADAAFNNQLSPLLTEINKEIAA